MRYLILVAFSLAAGAQSGRWEGSIAAPDKALNVIVNLDKNAQGQWTGTIDVPDQNAKGIPLDPVTVQDKTLRAVIKGVPGEQTFECPVGDGKSMDCKFLAGGLTMTAKLTRTGDAKFEAHPKSTAIAKDLEGDWEGTLQIPDKTLRLKFHLANSADGATGSLVSVDQGGVEIPITTITQKDANLKLDVAMINGGFEGDVSADRNQIVGNWSQGGGSLPLTLKRPAK